MHARGSERKNFSWESEVADGDSTKSEDESDSLRMILAEMKLKNQGRDLHGSIVWNTQLGF